MENFFKIFKSILGEDIILYKDKVYGYKLTELGKFQYQFYIDNNNLIFNINLERICPKNYRDNMVKFIDQANFHILIGFIIFNYQEGTIQFRHSVNIKSVEMTEKFIRNFFAGAFHNFLPNYLPIQYICQGKSVSYALSKV